MHISHYIFFNVMVVVWILKKKTTEIGNLAYLKTVEDTGYLPKMTSIRAKNPMKTNAGLWFFFFVFR